jgi:acyl-CoA reductase-like NAD-dependent aldehyde dehydrogenase
MSSEKILVHKSISGAFTTALQAASAAMYGSSQVLIQAVGSQKVSSLITSASKSGATLLPKPEKYQNPNEHHNVIVTGVTTDMELWHTESFGPVVMVKEFEDEEEAIKLANDTEYGLSAGVWTTDLARGIRIAKEIESGYFFLLMGVGMMLMGVIGRCILMERRYMMRFQSPMEGSRIVGTEGLMRRGVWRSF